MAGTRLLRDICQRQLRRSPETPLRASQGYYGLDFGLFRHLQRVFDLDAQVSDCALHFGMAQQ